MLTSLLQTIKPSHLTRQSTTPLESLTEDTHTYSLLFPDGNGPHRFNIDSQPHGYGDLHSPRTSATHSDFPIYNDVDLSFPRDVRILIAQAGTSSANAELIFDSKPPPVSESPRLNATRHSRNSSRTDFAVGSVPGVGRARGGGTAVSSIPEDHPHHRRTSSAFSTSGAFDRRARRTSISSVNSVFESSYDIGRDKDDVEKIALGCMFENATSSYKGMSNKVHIVPLASKPYENAYLSQSLGAELSSSFVKPQLVRKPSSLSKSHIPGDMLMPQLDTDLPYKSPPHIGTIQNEPNRRTVLVTRTFSISWVDEEAQIDEHHGFGPPISRNPEPQPNVAPQGEKRRVHSRTYRSPMYAVTIVLQLPIAPREDSPPISRTGTFGRKSMRKDSSSHHSTMSFGSYESERRAQWPGAESFSGLDAMASMALNSDVDDRVDLIGQHWDILSRTLTTLQTLAQNKILELLKPIARTTRILRVPTNALVHDADVKHAAEESGLRVVRGMRLPRARTGHGLWPAWREEARWLGNWASGREENFFFLILISAFLGTHTEWLQSLAPKAYRRKFREHQRLNVSNRMSVPNRTVIISANKMAARRLIFLLAAFLPTNHSYHGEGSPLRPGTSSSFRAYSQSPPSHFPISRQESLRRTINRRGKQGPSRAVGISSRASSVTATCDSVDDRTETGTIRPFGSEHHVRRPSDARSIRSKLAMTDLEPIAQKATAVTSPTTPGSIIVQPHFARQSSYGSGLQSGHSRSSSAASATLMQPLNRGDSTELQSARPWNPFKLFGLGQRRDSSSQYSDILQTTDEGLGIAGVMNAGSSSKLQQMVDEAHGSPRDLDSRRSFDSQNYRGEITSPELRDLSPERFGTTDGAKPIDVPLKMSVNKEDGVIDVEIPFGEFGSPAILSPTLAGDHSGSSYGGSSFGQHSILAASPRDPEHPLNVSGWLDKVHPDFTLQAIRPYSDMIKDIKAAMSAEPTPPLSQPLPDDVGTVEKWLDVCTTLVADTSSFAITRIRLRRLVRFVRSIPQVPTTPGSFNMRSQYGNPYRESTLVGSSVSAMATTEFTIDEKFEEETVSNMDHEFVDVVGRVTGMSANSSTAPSNTSSRSSSRRGRTMGMDDGTEPSGDNARDCQRLIIGRLETIVAAETREKSKTRNADEVDSKENTAPLHLNNLLREGIRKWLDDLDSKPVADSHSREEVPSRDTSVTSENSVHPSHRPLVKETPDALASDGHMTPNHNTESSADSLLSS
jgi:hypothetical protein